MQVVACSSARCKKQGTVIIKNKKIKVLSMAGMKQSSRQLASSKAQSMEKKEKKGGYMARRRACDGLACENSSARHSQKKKRKKKDVITCDRTVKQGAEGKSK